MAWRVLVPGNGSLISYGVVVVLGMLATAVGTDAGGGAPVPRTVRLMCSKAHDRDACVSSLVAHPDAATAGPWGLATIGITNAMDGVSSFHSFTASLRLGGHGGTGEESSLAACGSVLQDSHDQLKLSLASLTALNPTTFKVQMADTLTWLSSALTDHTTCLEGVSEMGTRGTIDAVMSRAGSVTTLLANAISLVAAITSFGVGHTDHTLLVNGLSTRRRLFETTDPAIDSRPIHKLTPNDATTTTNLTIVNAVVAKDGSGDYASIQDAIDAAPQNNPQKWVIHVKVGEYHEYVEVPKSAKNLVLTGDGIGKTIITGSKSVVGSNLTTFVTATMSVMGPKFLGRDFTVRNTAGPGNHQAVALKVQGDKSAFWRCAIEGYQDTLYAHSNRQFFRECTVSGTVDFVFGNAAAVFQSCTLLLRAPLPGQQNTVTAQGRTTNAQNTGLSFQNCAVEPAPELQTSLSNVKSYLGRPWKQYSRTVFLTTAVSSAVDPAGWLQWDGEFALATLFYGEYRNSGAGAASGARVAWATQIRDASVANQFTVNQFITAAEWLPQTSVACSAALYSN